jgi:hypothetical protein
MMRLERGGFVFDMCAAHIYVKSASVWSDWQIRFVGHTYRCVTDLKWLIYVVVLQNNGHLEMQWYEHTPLIRYCVDWFLHRNPST